MTKVANVALIKAERKRLGRPKKILDHRKLDSIQVAEPESAEQAIESLLIFDARCLDRDTRKELLRIVPQLLQIRRAWTAEYMECGCLSCHKKNPRYGGGGFCETCRGRIYQRMLKRYRKAMQGRNLPEEVAAFKDALCLRYNAAQRLFNPE